MTPKARHATGVLSFAFLACARLATADQPAEAGGAEYRAAIRQYRAGGGRAAIATIAGWPGSELSRAARRLDCFDRKDCEAAAVLHLEAAARSFEAAAHDDAAAQIAAGAEIARQWGAPARLPSVIAEFVFAWYLAAGHLQQAYGAHGDAFNAYSGALDVRPGDPLALLARASAVEAAVLPDGFGGQVVAEQTLHQLLGNPPGRRVAAGLQLRVGDPGSPDHVQLLKYLAREYRAVLTADRSAIEARLRLGRVLAATGEREQAAAELGTVVQAARDRFERALAHVCLARLAATAEQAAESYRAAITIDPSLRPAWLGLSEALWRMRDRPGAAAAAERAMAGERDGALNSWVEYHLGRGRAFTGVLAALRTRVLGAGYEAP